MRDQDGFGARRVCVYDGIRAEPAWPAWSAQAATTFASPAWSKGMRRRTYKRRSSETCSLRDRPV